MNSSNLFGQNNTFNFQPSQNNGIQPQQASNSFGGSSFSFQPDRPSSPPKRTNSASPSLRNKRRSGFGNPGGLQNGAGGLGPIGNPFAFQPPQPSTQASPEPWKMNGTISSSGSGLFTFNQPSTNTDAAKVPQQPNSAATGSLFSFQAPSTSSQSAQQSSHSTGNSLFTFSQTSQPQQNSSQDFQNPQNSGASSQPFTFQAKNDLQLSTSPQPQPSSSIFSFGGPPQQNGTSSPSPTSNLFQSAQKSDSPSQPFLFQGLNNASNGAEHQKTQKPTLFSNFGSNGSEQQQQNSQQASSFLSTHKNLQESQHLPEVSKTSLFQNLESTPGNAPQKEATNVFPSFSSQESDTQKEGSNLSAQPSDTNGQSGQPISNKTDIMSQSVSRPHGAQPPNTNFAMSSPAKSNSSTQPQPAQSQSHSIFQRIGKANNEPSPLRNSMTLEQNQSHSSPVSRKSLDEEMQDASPPANKSVNNANDPTSSNTTSFNLFSGLTASNTDQTQTPGRFGSTSTTASSARNATTQGLQTQTPGRLGNLFNGGSLGAIEPEKKQSQTEIQPPSNSDSTALHAQSQVQTGGRLFDNASSTSPSSGAAPLQGPKSHSKAFQHLSSSPSGTKRSRSNEHIETGGEDSARQRKAIKFRSINERLIQELSRDRLHDDNEEVLRKYISKKPSLRDDSVGGYDRPASQSTNKSLDKPRVPERTPSPPKQLAEKRSIFDSPGRQNIFSPHKPHHASASEISKDVQTPAKDRETSVFMHQPTPHSNKSQTANLFQSIVEGTSAPSSNKKRKSEDMAEDDDEAEEARKKRASGSRPIANAGNDIKNDAGNSLFDRITPADKPTVNGDNADQEGEQETPKPRPFSNLFGPGNANPTPSMFGNKAGNDSLDKRKDSGKAGTETPQPRLFANLSGAAAANSTPSLFNKGITHASAAAANKEAEQVRAETPTTRSLGGIFGPGNANPTPSLFPKQVTNGSASASEAGDGASASEGAGESEEAQAPMRQEDFTSVENDTLQDESLVHAIATAKLMYLDKSRTEGNPTASPYVNKGKGPLRIFKNAKTGAARVTMRIHPGGNVILNCSLKKDMEYRQPEGKKMVQFVAPDKEGQVRAWIVMVGKVDEAKKLAEVMEEIKD